MSKDNNNDARIDDIVAMLDNFATSDVGHINITVDENSTVEYKNIKQANSLECASGNMACNVPTFFDKEQEEQ